MRRAANALVWGGLVAIIVSLGAGCHAGDAGLTEQSRIHIQESATGKVYVAWSDAHEEDGALVVTGVVRRHDTVGLPIDVEVHATITAADGVVLDEATSDIVSVPRRSLTRVQGFQRFKIHFPTVPPAGSAIHLVAQRS